MEEQRASHAKSYCAISTHKLELAIFVLISLTDYMQTKGISHISFFLTFSEASSKGPYTGSLFNVFLLLERRHAMDIRRHTGLTNGECLWAGKL